MCEYKVLGMSKLYSKVSQYILKDLSKFEKRLVKIKLKVYDDMKKNKLKVILNEDGIDILNV